MAVIDFLSGKKTHIIALLMGIGSFFGYAPDENVTSLMETVEGFYNSPQMNQLLEAFGLSTLRAGVAKK